MCTCGHCESMPSAVESLCCRDIAIFRDRAGEQNVGCITEHSGFQAVCLTQIVVELSYLEYKGRYAAIPITELYKKFRYMACRQLYVFCYQRNPGNTLRVPLPACAVSKIRQTFNPEGDYRSWRLPDE